MTTKLVQKHLIKGTQEFEIVDDTVIVRINPRFGKPESLTVMLTVLNAEPVVSKSSLEFTSRVNNEPLLSLYLAKPDAEQFNAFVNLVKQRIRDEFKAFAGLRSRNSAMAMNSDEQPPEFGDVDTGRTLKSKEISSDNLDEAIRLLGEHIGTDEISDFIQSLENLKAEPQNDALLEAMIDQFEALGPYQGAVLSYAPYISALLSDDPYENL